MANVKLSRAELAKRAADQNEQNNDFLSMLGNLGSSSSPAEPEEVSNKTVTSIEEETVEEEIPVIRKTVNKSVTSVKKSAKEEKPGYISLVITPTLKKKWKTYCTDHGLSLTDCIKVSMKLLEDMERKEMISLEDGVLSYLS